MLSSADFIGLFRSSGTFFCVRKPVDINRAVPDSDRIDRVFAFPLQRIDLIGRLLGVLLVLVIPIGVFFALLILTGLVAVLGALVLGVPVVSGSTHVAAAAIPGVPAGGGASCTSAALDDGRAAAAVPGVRRHLLLLLLAVVRHVTLGKRRGSHQRQREHHAHQQAHDAPGHSACPFLHVCSPLFVERIYVKTFSVTALRHYHIQLASFRILVHRALLLEAAGGLDVLLHLLRVVQLLHLFPLEDLYAGLAQIHVPVQNDRRHQAAGKHQHHVRQVRHAGHGVHLLRHMTAGGKFTLKHRS